MVKKHLKVTVIIMSKYTTELRFICETYAGLKESEGYGDVATIIENARSKIFDFSFPIYDESYRSVLETKIIKHYYTREICTEVVGRWKLFLNERMNLIMPYFNQRYESTLLTFNPFYDVDLTTDHNIKGNADTTDNGNVDTTEKETIENTLKRTENTDYTDNSDTNTKQTNNDWEMYSDTPQGGLNGIESNTYLTNVTHNTNEDNTDITYTETATTDKTINEEGNETRNKTGNQKSSNTRVFTNTEDYLEHVVGKRGGLSYSKMLEEYRDTFLNIDNEIINSLQDLFFNLW